MGIKKRFSDDELKRVHLSLNVKELKLLDAAIKQSSFRSRSAFLVYFGLRAARRLKKNVE
jgi:hypothetical protein